MKKLLSVILVLVMLLSSVTVIAVADDIEDVTDGAPPVNDESPEATEESSENSSDESDVSEPPENDDITDEDDFTLDDEPLDDSEEETSGADEVVTEPEETTTEETTTEEATTEEATTEEATTEEITTEPDPFENVPAKLMCDVNNDGKVKADDARLILRCSVALEAIAPESLVYADYDLNGKVTAADARMALRTSVDLEKEVSRKFIVSDKKTASCSEDGYVKAKCNDPEKSVEITISKLQHSFEKTAYCFGGGECINCKKYFELKESHSYVRDYCFGEEICSGCGDLYDIPMSHDIKDGMCTKCGFMPDNAYYKSIADYLKKNGKYDKGVYYCDGTDEYAAYALCYEEKTGALYIICSTGVGIGSSVVYYDCYIDIPRTFKKPYDHYNVELYCHSADTLAAKAEYRMYPYDVDENLNALYPGIYESIPELQGKKDDFEIIAENLTYAAVEWVLAFGKEKGIKGLNYYNLGFWSYR